MFAVWFFNGCMLLLGIMLGVCGALAWKLVKELGRHRRELDAWRARMDEIRAMMERAKRDAGTVLDKIEDATAQQIQDWNEIQREIAVLDGRLGKVERRFGPLAPEPVPAPEPEPVLLAEPVQEQEAPHD